MIYAPSLYMVHRPLFMLGHRSLHTTRMEALDRKHKSYMEGPPLVLTSKTMIIPSKKLLLELMGIVCRALDLMLSHSSIQRHPPLYIHKTLTPRQSTCPSANVIPTILVILLCSRYSVPLGSGKRAMNPPKHTTHRSITGGGLFAVPGSGLFRVITWRDYLRRQQLIPAFTSPRATPSWRRPACFPTEFSFPCMKHSSCDFLHPSQSSPVISSARSFCLSITRVFFCLFIHLSKKTQQPHNDQSHPR